MFGCNFHCVDLNSSWIAFWLSLLSWIAFRLSLLFGGRMPLCFGSKVTTWWSLYLCGCSWGCSVLSWILLLNWLDGSILAFVYCHPIKVWYVTSWNTLLVESPLFAKIFVVICNLFRQCNLLHICDVYHGDVAFVVSDFHIVAMHLYHSVVSFVQGLEAFGCVVLDQDEDLLCCWLWCFLM